MEFSKDAIHQFVESNLSNFSINGSGWHSLIRDMLYEFCLAGWNLNDRVGGKEKFGGLRCYFSSPDEDVNVKIQEIISKYMKLSGKTCEKCGKEGKGRFVNSWETTLCFEHYLEKITVINLKDDRIELHQSVIYLKDILRVEFRSGVEVISLFFTDAVTGKEKSVSFLWQEPNYYLLLKSIPKSVFPKEVGDYISEMFDNLRFCEVCGYNAVHNHLCLRCHYDEWNDKFLEDYDHKLQYIKHCQMDVFIDEDDYEKIFQYDKSFEKNPNHKFLFNDDELEEYKKELQEMDL